MQIINHLGDLFPSGELIILVNLGVYEMLLQLLDFSSFSLVTTFH